MARILFTANTAWSMANFRSGLIRALIADEHSVTILAPQDARANDLTAMGCRFVPLTMDNKGTSIIKDALLFLQFKKFLKKETPDLVISYTIKNNIYGALAAKQIGVPFIPVVTGLGAVYIKRTPLTAFVSWLYRAAFKKLPRVLFLNSDDSALFQQLGIVSQTQAVIFPGEGVDTKHFGASPLPKNPRPVFLLIARMIRYKGIAEFAEAAKHLRDAGIPAHARLLGPLPKADKDIVRHEDIEAWQREGYIEYVGETQDVREEIARADCVVLPSYYREGLPRCLLEASSMARPVIASDIAGCRDIVDEYTTGLLCTPRDTSSLYEAMKHMTKLSWTERTHYGKNARAKVEAVFDEQRIIALYKIILTDALKAGT